MRSENHDQARQAYMLSPSPFAIAAPSMVRCGYSPLPIVRGGKAPGVHFPMRGWQTYCDNVASPNVINCWSVVPGVGVGVACGRGLVAVDIDRDDLIEPVLAGLPCAMVIKKGLKGLTAFFRGDTSKIPSRNYNAADRGGLVDLLSHKRQSVIPPTLHKDTGEPYVWLTESTLLNTPLDRLSELPDNIAERLGDILREYGFDPENKRPARVWADQSDADVYARRSTGDSIYRKINDLALADLQLWVPALGLRRCYSYGFGYKAVCEWRASSTGRDFSRRSPNLYFSKRGIRDFGSNEGYSPLDVVMAACGLSLDNALDWLGTRVDPSWNEAPIILTSGRFRREQSHG